MKINDYDKIKNNIIPDGINGQDEFMNFAVIVILIERDGEYQVIFEKRNENIAQGGEICFPGGMLDNEETPIEAGLRETFEELGIKSEKISVNGQLNTVITTGGAIIDAFTATVDINFSDIIINPGEVEKCFSIPLSYFMNTDPEEYCVLIQVLPSFVDKCSNEECILLPAAELGLPELYSKPWGRHRHKVYVYKTEYGIIWGITARIMYDFVCKIKSQLK